MCLSTCDLYVEKAIAGTMKEGTHGMAATDRGWLSGAPSQPLYRLMIQLHWKLPAMARINILESVKLMSAQGFINWIYSLHRPKEPRGV